MEIIDIINTFNLKVCTWVLCQSFPSLRWIAKQGWWAPPTQCGLLSSGGSGVSAVSACR